MKKLLFEPYLTKLPLPFPQLSPYPLLSPLPSDLLLPPPTVGHHPETPPCCLTTPRNYTLSPPPLPRNCTPSLPTQKPPSHTFLFPITPPQPSPPPYPPKSALPTLSPLFMPRFPLPPLTHKERKKTAEEEEEKDVVVAVVCRPPKH